MTIRDLSSALRNQPPAEHEYDWAPIHAPGSIQPYGVLLVVDPRTRRIQFVSNNSSTMLGLAPADILGKSYLSLIDIESEQHYIRDRISEETILFPNPVRMTIRGHAFDAVFHSEAGSHMIEIEPAATDIAAYDELSLRATAELYDPPSIDDLYQRAVRVVSDVTGFDRVMLYRFDSRYNGQVIAEVGKPELGSFLGLFFPSSDIGARARKLYLESFTRYIPNIGGEPVPLTGIFPGGGHADTGHPIDMSHTNLRSVVPCHVTYLRNIGVQASMSFSVNVDGRLWGLFACHNYTPKTVSYVQRVVCEQAAMMFIFRLASMGSASARFAQRQKGLAHLSSSVTVGASLRRRLAALNQNWAGAPDQATAQALIARAVAAIEAETVLLAPTDPQSAPNDAVLTSHQQLLLDLAEADSAAIIRHGNITRIGDAPPPMAIFAIASMFGRELPDLRNDTPHVFATDGLPALVPAATDIKDRAAGIMAASLSPHSPCYLMWFRREQIVHATWAGNPTADAMSRGSEGLNPRASFDAWKQDIRNLSRPWVIEDVQVADELSAMLRALEAPDDYVTDADVSPLPGNRAPAVPQPVRPSDGPERRVIRIGQR
jgi:light-regulated signal transduction histidine kinase (bacteriophytochrome)